jgi:YD repeat-containing protein
MVLLCIAALLAHATPASAASAPGLGGGSSKCDPTVQSCAPGTGGGIDLGGGGGGGGGGSCTPSPGGSPCGGAGPATQGNSSSTNQGAGNPIHLINGNKYQREVDMPALPGVLGLEVVRHYNSSYSRAYVPPGMLGRGWLLSYEARLYDHPTNLQIVQADGTRIIFSKLRERPSLCASEQPGNGIVRIEGPDKHYTWQWMDGRELRFNHLGRLTRISLPSGEQVRMDYNAKGNRLLKVTSTPRWAASTTATAARRCRAAPSPRPSSPPTSCRPACRRPMARPRPSATTTTKTRSTPPCSRASACRARAATASP